MYQSNHIFKITSKTLSIQFILLKIIIKNHREICRLFTFLLLSLIFNWNSKMMLTVMLLEMIRSGTDSKDDVVLLLTICHVRASLLTLFTVDLCQNISIISLSVFLTRD
jgi:hypothetical protein